MLFQVNVFYEWKVERVVENNNNTVRVIDLCGIVRS